MNVLLIQDHPASAAMLIARLRDARFAVTHVGNEPSACSAVANTAFDAVVFDPSFGMDVGTEMPYGLALYDKLRPHFGNARVLMVGNPVFLEDGMADEMRRRSLPFIEEHDFNPNAQLR